MSRQSVYRHHSRFDSALDLSHGHHHIPNNDVEDTQSVAAGSVVAPWSPYNTRGLDQDLIPSRVPSSWPPDLPASGNLAPTDGIMQAFECSFLTTDPILRCTSPDSLPVCNGPLPTTLSRHVPFDKDPSATDTPALNAGEHAEVRITLRGDWGQNLTETPLTPNRRHEHLYHRQDGTMKHARKRHTELHLPPIQTQYNTEYCLASSSSHRNLNYNVGQWLHGDQASITDSTIKEQLEVNSPARTDLLFCDAQYLLTTLAKKLERTDFSYICNAFFTRWESIVQRLSSDKSDAYPVYFEVLEDIRFVVDFIQDTNHSPCGQRERPHPSRRAEPRGNSALALGRGTASRTDRITRRDERKKSPSNGSGKNVLVALTDSGKDDGRREVDCPVFKHHIMHNTAPPCRGCRVTVMSQVRSHLNPNRAAGTHRSFPQFVKQCSRCKQDFVDRELYDNHKMNDCVFQLQIRGDIVVSWARQYLALYPDAQRIPLPWPNEIGWLPDAVLEQCRAPRTESISPSAFLDEGQEYSDLQPQMMTGNIESTEAASGYAGATSHVLDDLTNPTFLRSSGSSPPVHDPDRRPAISIQVTSTGAIDSNGHHWQNTMAGFQTLQETMLEALPHLNEEQLGFMVTECERMLAFSRGSYRQHHLEQPQDQGSIATPYASLSVQGSDGSYRSSSQSQHLQTSHYSQFEAANMHEHNGLATPSTDALSSTRSYGASSSQHPTLTLTNPSSHYSPIDPSLLSPYSASSQRRTSLPPDTNVDAPRLSLAFFSRTSLPDDADAYIDPSFIISPSDDNGGYFSDFLYRHPGSDY